MQVPQTLCAFIGNHSRIRALIIQGDQAHRDKDAAAFVAPYAPDVHEHTSVPFYMDGSLRPAFDLEP